jgi:hypothetical protein
VKPGNILVRGEHAYVCDFGLARHVAAMSSLTGDRGFVGTIDYVPPEQIEGGTIDGRADEYSLGCVLFECLAGERPFDRESELSVVFAHLNEPPPGATDLRPELPAAFDDVVATALAKSLDERYPTCGDLAVAARAALRGETFARRKSHRRRYVAAAAAALVVAAVVATTAVLATGGGSTNARNSAAPAITATTLHGARVGQRAAYYKHLLGPYRTFTITEFPTYHVRALQFQQPQIGVYFHPGERTAGAITTWNRNYKTPEGIGPCSTIAQMKAAYGRRVVPTYAGTSPDGKKVSSWGVGRTLLFATQNQSTISAVALYRAGDPRRDNPHTSLANYVAALETACK